MTDIDSYDISTLKLGEEIVDGKIVDTGRTDTVGVVVVQEDEDGPWRYSATPWILTPDGPRHTITGERPTLEPRAL